MASKPSFIDSIKATLPPRHQGGEPWYRRVDQKVLSELTVLRAEWQAGQIDTGCKTLARAIADRLNAEGLSTIGTQGVVAWLKRND